MQANQYVYTFTYDDSEFELCQLESRHIFKKKVKHKLLFSDVKIEPSSSAFIKNRLDIITYATDYSELIGKVKEENIHSEGFKAEYLVLDGDTTNYADRLSKLKDVGWSIEGDPDYYNPSITYGLCYYKGVWYFGLLIKDTFDWYKHSKKPYSFSNSIGVNIAKALVNIATGGDEEKRLIDACCGVGTILLEACFAGIEIDGCDINWKACRDARKNLSHFDYPSTVFRSDIKDINKQYDAAILDLPYNLYSRSSDEDVLHIIKSSAELTNRLVIVSTSDITDFIESIGFEIADSCSVSKKGKNNFARKIWVCDKRLT
ncbi:TRM11 family SAM-dependent methyltransferase [Carboxylicivirga sp. N1Y90]|uniref:TRM11 family SAM-dependent methyltransferase n=1 Tax=Carboxylicivirga fragile TaxID=3417571 RepID=UPI003D3459AC|nr:methyltransferase [Marinilabiliaceae bacterium N1Y90]